MELPEASGLNPWPSFKSELVSPLVDDDAEVPSKSRASSQDKPPILGSKDDRWWDCVLNKLLSDLPSFSLYSDDESEPV